MAHDIQHLKREIEALEKQLSGQHFGGLFDRKRMDQVQDKLKKKRKELARLEAGDELDGGPDHVEIPEFIPGVEVTPDIGPEFPLDLDADDLPVRLTTSKKHVAKPTGKTATRVAAKKPIPKPKPAAKPKPAPRKKSAVKPAKKKTKR